MDLMPCNTKSTYPIYVLITATNTTPLQDYYSRTSVLNFRNSEIISLPQDFMLFCTFFMKNVQL